MKNKCGAKVGDIWSLGVGGDCYLLLDVKEVIWSNHYEDTFYALRLKDGKYEEVYFSHSATQGWEFVA